jgi:NAD(P)-dependent dehydrogenase (short-subunit alcohol dehydrogenase family)
VSGIDDAVIAVVGIDTSIGGRIAERLAARDAAVVGLTRSPRSSGPAATTTTSAARGGGAVAVVVVEGEGPEAVVAAIEAAAGGRRVAAVLHAEIEPARCGEARLAELTPEAWRERCAGPIDRALWTARAGFTLMATGDGRPGQGGVLGFVCPSAALTGAAGHVALATAGEAVRLLAKSAARRWGRFGITSNAFAPHLAACVPPAGDGAGDSDGGGRLQVHATALDPGGVDPADDIASLLLYLAGPGPARLTGATFGTDGGELMAP